MKRKRIKNQPKKKADEDAKSKNEKKERTHQEFLLDNLKKNNIEQSGPLARNIA